MFSDDRYAAFVDTWRRIATRCAPVVQTTGRIYTNRPRFYKTPAGESARMGPVSRYERDMNPSTTPLDLPASSEPAFLFGCGRFRMEERLLERCPQEILRFGRRPLVVCDATSRAVAGDAACDALRGAGAAARVLEHGGFCCREDALAVAESGGLDGVDVVVGCGGGLILDFSKCLAHLAGAPLVTIPTSSAQCCAYTSIACCYTREGRYVSTSHFAREPAAALLDLSILARQPSRLLAAGALDAMAKKIEIEFWTQLDARTGAGASGAAAPSGIAAAISDFIHADIDGKIDAALAGLGEGGPSPALRDVVFDSVVGAGIVSGISGGSRQVALAHRLYYGARTLHPALAARYTHGELVAVGLVMQHVYNGAPEKADALAARLRKWGLAASMGELGFGTAPGDLGAWTAYLLGTKTMKAALAADAGSEKRLRESMGAVFR